MAVGRGPAVQAQLHTQDLQRQRNMFQLTADPGKPGSPGSPCKESGDELPWRRAAFPLEIETAVGDKAVE